MNIIDNNNDDQCQDPGGCIKSFFTYCPHCHLFLCISHINQHYNTVKSDVNRMIDEADNQRILLEQHIDKIKRQQTILNNLYECEIKHSNDMYKFVVDICEKKINDDNRYSLTFESEKKIKEFQMIKQEQEKDSFMKLFTIQIDQILQGEKRVCDIKPKDETSLLSEIDHDTTNDSSASYEMMLTDPKILAFEESYKEEEEESTMDCNTNDSLIDNQDEIDPDNFSLNSKWLINLVNPICPLSTINALGISTHHNISGVPCNFLQNVTSLTYGRCYYHLITYHRLKQTVAKMIMSTLSSNEKKNTDLTTLNIFSKWKSNDLLSKSKTLFIGQCPLTQENIYGLQRQHRVPLCTPRPPVHLYQHLRTVHQFTAKSALRLIHALIDNEPVTKEIFRPNEVIINIAICSKNRPKTRSTIN